MVQIDAQTFGAKYSGKKEVSKIANSCIWELAQPILAPFANSLTYCCQFLHVRFGPLPILAVKLPILACENWLFIENKPVKIGIRANSFMRKLAAVGARIGNLALKKSGVFGTQTDQCQVYAKIMFLMLVHFWLFLTNYIFFKPK